jgi:membrane-associated phospholipid phosphatase
MNIKHFPAICILITLFLIISNSILISQTNNSSSQNVFQTIISDFGIAFSDGYHLLISPSEYSAGDWLIAGSIVLSTTATIPFDEDIRKYSQKNHSDFNDKSMNLGKAYGNLLSPVIIGGSIYSYGLFFKNESVRTTGRMIIETVAYAGVITTILKSLFGRSRPYTEDGSHFFRLFQIDDNHLSLPSGHSTVAFSVSTVLANRIHNVYASIGLYTLAAITSVSRVYHDEHWASDVFLGSAIGFFVGNFISNNSGDLYTNKNKKVLLNIQPAFNGLRCNLLF